MKKNVTVKSVQTTLMIMLVISLSLILSCDDRKATEPKPIVEKPVFSPTGGNFADSVEVTITTVTEEARIYYTLDGTNPTEISNFYTNPVVIDSTLILKARAYQEKWQESEVQSAIYAIIYTVATPTFLPAAGHYEQPQQVEILCSTAGASIYYTLNGEEPTPSSLLYEHSLEITATTTIKARAYKEGYVTSNIAEASYILDLEVVANPVFNPPAGLYNESLQVTISTVTENANIFFTTNGEEPTQSSTLYETPVLIEETTTIKARAYKQGLTPSESVASLYTIDPGIDIVDTPVLTPPGGEYYEIQNISIQCSTPDAFIYYTIDGEEPTEMSSLYETPIEIALTTTIKARAFKEDWTPSNIAEEYYIMDVPTVTAPIFNPPAGNFDSPQLVTISSTTPEAMIYYTLNGDEPTESSIIYEAPVQVNISTIIKARAYKTGLFPSSITQANYTLTLETVSTPTFDPPEGQYNEFIYVELTSATPDAQIYYTTTGAEPTQASTLYTQPVNITAMATLRAKAFKTGMNPSETGTAVYDMKVATPTFNPEGGDYDDAQLVEITSLTPEVQIRFTTNGDEPTFGSQLYTAPINVNQDMTLKARAFKSNWTPSEVGRADYIIDYAVIPGMILMPFGSYIMGNTRGGGGTDELPTHEINLSAFYISTYQVTQAEWVAIMGFNPSGFDDDETRPVDSISWYWALIYCNRRSIAEGLTPVYTINNSTDPDEWGAPPEMGYNRDYDMAICNWEADGYRLPTEAEWEYAARSAVNEPDYLYSGSNNIDEVAWYTRNSNATTHPVGRKAPNEMGIYGMSGNVFEWCWDWYAQNYYAESPDTNPTGPTTGQFRCIRGGSYAHSDDLCRIQKRMNGFPYRANNFMGLRVVRSLR